MKKEICSKWKNSDIIVTLCTLLVAGLLIWHCAQIYFTGISAENLSETGVRLHDIYSREIVAEHLQKIWWAFALWILSILWAALHRQNTKESYPSASPEIKLALLKRRTDINEAMKKEEQKRLYAGIACTIFCIFCGAAVLGYFLDLSHFASRELETVVGKMLRWVLPWVVMAFAGLLVFDKFKKDSILREIREAEGAARHTAEPAKETSGKRKNAVRLILYAVAVLLIVSGIRNGGMYDVLAKAVAICTECIGLG